MKRKPDEVLFRSETIDRAGLKEDTRTVDIAFSSETPVERYFGTEILDHSPEAVDLSRLNNGAALLVEHDSRDQVGVVEEAWVGKDRVGRARVRFGKSSRAEEIYEDVKSGIRRLVSVGYRILAEKETREPGGKVTVRALSWVPAELSIVAVPADISVGVGRSAETENTQANDMKILLDHRADGGGGAAAPAAPAPAPAPAGPTRAEILAESRQRIQAIDAITENVNTETVRALRKEAIEKDWPLAEFQHRVLTSNDFKAKPITSPDTAEIGMTDKEVKRYSMVRAMNMLANKTAIDGLEREASDAVAKNLGRRPTGFFVPTDVLARSVTESRGLGVSDVLTLAASIRDLRDMVVSRALTSNVFSAGGALVDTNLLTGSLIELLRNKMLVASLGARSLTGLVGDIAIPKHTGGATAYWLAQGAAVTRSQQTVGQLALTPHRLAASTAYDKQLLAQSSLSVEAFVREDLMTVLALEKDRVAIDGDGVNGEPLGIVQTTGLSTTVTLATANAPIFTEIIKFETNLATNNADAGNLSYLVSPAVRGHCKGFPKFASTGTPIWEGNEMNGYPAAATNQMPSATPMIFGKWSDLIIADWDGMDVVVNPYTLDVNGQISITIQTLTDLGIRNPVSFAKGINP